MIGLILDNSHLLISIAIVKNNKILYFRCNDKNKQLESLNSMIEEAMCITNIRLDNISYLAISLRSGYLREIRAMISITNIFFIAFNIYIFYVSNFDIVNFLVNIKEYCITPLIGRQQLRFQSVKKGDNVLNFLMQKKKIYFSNIGRKKDIILIINARTVAYFLGDDFKKNKSLPLISHCYL